GRVSRRRATVGGARRHALDRVTLAALARGGRRAAPVRGPGALRRGASPGARPAGIVAFEHFWGGGSVHRGRYAVAACIGALVCGLSTVAAAGAPAAPDPPAAVRARLARVARSSASRVWTDT